MRQRRFVRAGLLFGAVLASFLLTPGSSRAYEGDHFAWTYYLALQLGCTERQAYQIASGAYAIDWDPETAPLPGGQDPNQDPTALGFVGYTGYTVHGWIAGAADSFEILQGTPPGRLQNIWLQFHAFSPSAYVGLGDQVETFKARRKQELFELARRQRNPGPLIHYLQDYHAHYGWEDVRGHALAGHLPDFLSDNPARARRMTEETLSWLTRFLTEVLGQTPRTPDRGRIQEVLDRLIEVNRYPAGLPSADRVRFALPTEEELLARFDAGETFREVIQETLLAVDPEGGFNWYAFKLTVDNAPALGASLTVVREAIEEDKRAGRLIGGWRQLLEADPEAPIGAELLPSRWIVYDYDSRAVVTNDAYAVERLELEVGEPAVQYVPEGEDGPVEVTVRLPYRVSGVVDIPNLPRPLIGESSEIADFETVRSFRDLEAGSFAMTKTFRRGRERLAEGIDWRGTIAMYGAEPVVRQVTLRYTDREQDTEPEPTDDLERLLRELEETAEVASGAAARARGRCAQADEIARGGTGELDAVAARLDELRDLLSMTGGAPRVPSGDPEAARTEAARARRASDALAALRDRAGALRAAACDGRSAAVAELNRVEASAREQVSELRSAVEALRRLAPVNASAPSTDGSEQRAGTLASELRSRLDALEARLAEAGNLLGSVSSDLDLLSAQEARGSSLLETILRLLPTARAGADTSERMDRAFGRLRAAVDSAAGCDADVGGRLADAQSGAATLRSELAGLELPTGSGSSPPEPPADIASAGVSSLLAEAESQLAVAELFVESIVNRVVEAQACLDDAATSSDDSTAEGAVAEGLPEASSGGWAIDDGVETVDERPTDRSPGSIETSRVPPGPEVDRGAGAGAEAAADAAADAVGRAQGAFARCDFRGALTWADRVASLDPGNAWLVANRSRIAALAARQRRTVAELEVARGLIRSGRFDRARDALAAAAREAPGCMSGPIAATNREVVTAIAERRTSNREALASGLTSLIGAIGQAAAAVQGSRNGTTSPPVGVPATPFSLPRAAPGSSAPPTSGDPASGGTAQPTCYTVDLRFVLEPAERQAAAEWEPGDEKVVWYVEEYSIQGGRVYSVVPAGSRSAERQFAIVRQYTAPYGVAVARQGPFGSLSQAWNAAVARCSNLISPQR